MHRGLCLAALLAIGLAIGVGAAPEPWADARLDVLDGLQLWLDAAKADSTGAQAGSPVAVWKDSSGHGRHVRQTKTDAQPKLLEADGARFLRFDGVDDHLRLTGIARELEAATVFIVAAPHDNPGDFRGFLAANAKNRRDYESGFTIDQSYAPTARFEAINVEGRGFGGAQDLHNSGVPFGRLQTLEAIVDPVHRRVSLALDGEVQGKRTFQPGPLSFDELTIGARYYTNGPGPQQVRGFFPGDLVEVLIYDRVLSADETRRVRGYLQKKHERLAKALPATLPQSLTGGFFLTPEKDPPPVKMLVPGFTVRELPLQLTNINNVRYRPDGKLVALGYNGNIWLLSDADGDGLEDKADLFWDNQGKIAAPIGMALTPPNYPRGNGAFVTSKGKLSLIVDTNGDDKADQEVVVADGWPGAFHQVDALGVALDREGSIYFGIGTPNFANGHMVDEKTGKSQFNLEDPRGTIQRVSADFSKRETVCTGIRFSVALAFNRHGDLFATDQEGATWLPNGNPFDELLHIQPGRHYGFPPRHPKHLPSVIDEPSVCDYGPQHQSTCGLAFNEPVNGGPVFGPKHWAGNAIVCGESRGKLYRTELVKTRHGYVARNHIIACLQMLTVDACVSPQGDLVVACHSGPPDWGTGPTGKGKLFKISYADRSTAQPVFAYPSGPQEVRIAFDRPLEPEQLQGLAKGLRITYGEYVRAGDRFETLKPPYQIVQNQTRTPRFELPVLGVQMTPDRRTLLVQTAPQTAAVHYAIQMPAAELDYALTGLLATLEAKTGERWSGWLPHLDLAVAREFTRGSAEHDRLWQLMEAGGALKLDNQLKLDHLLQPAIQPGAKLDYEPPPEQVTLAFTSSSPMTVAADGAKVQTSTRGATLSFEADNGKPRLVPARFSIDGIHLRNELGCSWHTADDPRERALPLHRFVLPWAKPSSNLGEIALRPEIPELKGGSWGRGRKIFFSEEALCSKCHVMHGQGGTIGPDLSNLPHRDYASVLRDLTEPSFAINPDFVSYTLALHDGRTLTGPIRTQDGKLLVGNDKGEVITIDPDNVERRQLSAKSIMPDDLARKLGPDKLRDLLTFLLNEPPRMPVLAKGTPPKPRSRAEVQAVLAGAPNPPEKVRPLNIVLVAGPKDHGPGEHDYPAWQKAWAELLAAADHTTVGTAWEWPSAEQLKAADVLVFYQHGSWTPERARDIDAYLARGGGLVYIHWAVDGSPDAPSFAQRIGLAARGGMIRFRHGPIDLGFETGSRHPIGRNFDKVHFHDETYWKLVGDPARINLLAWSVEEGERTPQFWTIEPSQGRVFVSILGHFAWTFDDPLFRALLLRGIAWSAKEPVDRFNALTTLGIKLAE